MPQLNPHQAGAVPEYGSRRLGPFSGLCAHNQYRHQDSVLGGALPAGMVCRLTTLVVDWVGGLVVGSGTALVKEEGAGIAGKGSQMKAGLTTWVRGLS